MLFGTPTSALRAAEKQLAEVKSKDAKSLFKPDLAFSTLPLHRGTERHRRAAPLRRAVGPVNAALGGNIELNPQVWAPSVSIAASNNRVLNPYTNEVQPLSIQNALLHQTHLVQR